MSRAGFAQQGLIAMLLLAVTFGPLAAQRRGPFGSSGGGRGFFMIGAQQVEIDDLNDALTDAGYPDFNDTFLTLGGGGFGLRNRLLIGGEGHALIQTEETTPDGEFRTGLFGGYGMFNLGYQVFRSGNLSLFPIVGIGGGAMTLRIRERETISFDDALEQPRREVNLSNGGLLVGGALDLEWFVPGGSGRGGFVLGVRAGYNYSPLEADWSFGGSDVAGGPDASLSGAYVRLSLGGGRR